jgi:uncharacterized protein YigE (DUF2233 family)
MKFIYSILILFCLFNISSFTNIEILKSNNLNEVNDSTLKGKIIEVVNKFKDTVYQYDVYDYDFKATGDSIKLLDDSLKSYPEKLDKEFNKAYKFIQKSMLTDSNNSFAGFRNEFNILHSFVNKLEKDTAEIKSKLKKLNTSLKSLKGNREIFDQILQSPKKEISSSILKIQTPTVLKLDFIQAKFKVVIINNQFNNLKIIPNITGSPKTIKSQYASISKASYGVLMNAGMFEKDGSGVGLLISGRKKINEINLKKNLPGNFYTLSNAIFFSDTLEKNFIVSTPNFNDKYKNSNYTDIAFATQSGPALIIDGKINPELNLRSQNNLIRNGVGVVKNANNNIVIFIISETPTTFYELASLFNFLGCDNAMYLDGTVSQLLLKGPNKETDITSRADLQPLGPLFSITSKEFKKDTVAKTPTKKN